MRRLLPSSILFLTLLLPATAPLHAEAASAPDRSSAAEAADATAEVGAESGEVGAESGEVGAESGEIDLKLIMGHPDWLGNPPEDPYWADDGSSILYWQKRQGEEHWDLHRVDLEGNHLGIVEPEDMGRVSVDDGELSADRAHKVYEREGDLYRKDLGSGEIRQLTRTAEEETDPRFLVGDTRVSFQRGEAIYVRDLETGLETQAAELRLEKDPAEDEPEGFLEHQQLDLIRWVREQREKRELARERSREEQRRDSTRPPLPWYLSEEVEVLDQALSPAGDWMLVALADADRDDGKKDQMPSYVSESGYVEIEEVRAKVGTHDGSGERLLLLDLAAHESRELDLGVLPGIRDDPLAEIRAAGEAWRAARGRSEAEEAGGGADGEGGEDAEEDATDGEGEAEEETEEPAPRPVVFEEDPVFSPDGRYVAVQAHSRDNKDRWIAVASKEKPELVPVHRLSDKAWINWYYNEYGWLPDSRRLYFLSEESGYSQLYLHDVESGERRRLTRGEHVVMDPQLSPDGEWIYYTANPSHPGVYETFRVRVADGHVERLSSLGGRSSYRLSPDGRRLLLRHSTMLRPPELYVQEARPGAEARRLTETVSEAFASREWTRPEIVEVPSSHHERPIYSRLYLPGPEDPPPAASGERAAVVFVHGAGYLQNAHKGWSGYFREFMFHTLLTRHGYVVLDMDYRASRGYGRDWRTAIYRRMGTPELEDLRDGVDYLVERHGVDPDRVGVYGGSYGGFMTFMALFQAPELFAAGAALRPVTDWAHYNHPYTSNILNTPEIDPEAYARSSPIEFAAGLERPLLICAPMLDDNVFFQDTVRLVQVLIELEKENWEVALYPVEPHGFREPSSWLDEYRRIFRLFETYLAP